MKKALVVGGNSGIGLALVLNLLDEQYEHIYIVGKDFPRESDIPQDYRERYIEKTSFTRLNLINEEYGIFDEIQDIDTLLITAGFGRVAPFEQLHEKEIDNLVKCNQLSIIQIVKKYYSKIHSHNDFYTLIMGSIAGHICSPLFSIYGAAKAGLCAFIENINAELAAQGYSNRILDVSPGSIKNTSFNGGQNNIRALYDFTKDILHRAKEREIRYIPQYEEIYQNVIARNQKDPLQYGIDSYHYKLRSGRLAQKPQLCVGYLSGTFDLFHIGHLNLLRKAKRECDYLIVGVHKDGSWKGKETFIPFEERVEIVRSIQYVDRVIQSFAEDSDAYAALHYNKLFVGSDYKGTKRFETYEKYFADKEVEIVYFDYTQGISSTQLRQKIKEK